MEARPSPSGASIPYTSPTSNSSVHLCRSGSQPRSSANRPQSSRSSRVNRRVGMPVILVYGDIPAQMVYTRRAGTSTGQARSSSPSALAWGSMRGLAATPRPSSPWITKFSALRLGSA